MPAGAREHRDQSRADRIVHLREDDRHGVREALERLHRRRAARQESIRLQCHKFLRKSLHTVGVVGGEAHIDADVAAFRPSELQQTLLERRDEAPDLRIVLCGGDQRADPPHCALLAPAASGHAAAAPPSSVKNERRFNRSNGRSCPRSAAKRFQHGLPNCCRHSFVGRRRAA